MDERGHATEIRAEAGFLQLKSYDVEYPSGGRTIPRARIWYAFSPADKEPEDAPLVVLFNGAGVIRSELIPRALDRLFPEIIVEARQLGEKIEVHSRDGEVRTIVFPYYAHSGHAVSVYEPQALHHDVAAWITAGG